MERAHLNYLFKQFRVPRRCLGYVIAEPVTRLAALVDPELEMVEPIIDYVFEHDLRPAYSHRHSRSR